MHVDFSESVVEEKSEPQEVLVTPEKSGVVSIHTGIFASAVLLTGIGVMFYLKRSNNT